MTELQAVTAEDLASRWLEKIHRWFVVVGGIVLVAIALMSVASIAGRSLFGKPVPSDLELIQIGCAICVAAFVPWCQMPGTTSLPFLHRVRRCEGV